LTDMTEKSGLEIFVHPLVVINISDHFTRDKCVNKNPRVFGVLLGQQEGRRIEISNSFEMLISEGKVDHEFMNERQDQFFRVYEKESCEILGWYATGQKVGENDIQIHEQMEAFNEAPLFLLLDNEPKPRLLNNQGELSMSIFESSVRIVNNKPVTSFSQLKYSIATTEIERIAVDHVAHDTAGVKSQLAAHAGSLYQSIKMLHVRISILKEYLDDVKTGKLAVDQSVLRALNSICNQLPAIDSNEFNEAFFTEYNDTLLLTYLAAISKASSAQNEMLEKFNTTQDKQFRKRGMF